MRPGIDRERRPEEAWIDRRPSRRTSTSGAADSITSFESLPSRSRARFAASLARLLSPVLRASASASLNDAQALAVCPVYVKQKPSFSSVPIAGSSFWLARSLGHASGYFPAPISFAASL